MRSLLFGGPMKILIKPLIFLFALLIMTSACKQNKPAQSYEAKINEWHKKREQSLTKKDSWLSLSGLFWLNEGENTFGSDKSNQIIFPEKAPAFMGGFYVRAGKVKVILKKESGVTIDGKSIPEKTLVPDVDGEPTLLQYGSLSWYVIKRGDKFLIRLKDSESPALLNFTGVERYPVAKKWRVKARLKPYDPPKKLKIANVLGQVSETDCPGVLLFEIEGKTYRLEPEGKRGDKKWFLNFSDETSGRETYGAGRYLVLDVPDEKGDTHIDFNKAYNPPCAFSPYATCPLPPKGNHLSVKITAGEKDYGHH